MRLPSAANKVLTIAAMAFLFAGCNSVKKSFAVYPIHDADMTGTWMYTSVTRGDTVLFPVTKSDTMILRSDHSFRYDIESAGKHSSGSWKLLSKDQSHTLELRYLPEYRSRFFTVTKCTEDTLVFEENRVVFSYIRKKL